MAITDKEKGVWGLDQVYNKINQGSIWQYNGVIGLWQMGSGGAIAGQNTNPTPSHSSPIQIPGSTWDSAEGKFDVMDYNNYSAGAIKTDGTLWTWGNNGDGELGQNNLTAYSSPRQVGSGSDWKYINLRVSCGLAVKTDGTLWSWGNNTDGNLGHNQKGGAPHSGGVSYSSPKQIPGTTWSTAHSAGTTMLATKTDGTLWSWGEGGSGQLANNLTAKRSSPVQIPGTTWGTDPSMISSTYSQSTVAAIKTDGTLWSWGSGGQGKQGRNDTSDSSSPRQVGSDTTWSKIAGGKNGFHAIKTDGTAWSWGDNESGQLGLSDKVYRSSPTQIGSGTNWSRVAPYDYFGVMTKSDGTAWAMGSLSGDKIGLNNTDTAGANGTLAQVAGTGWVDVQSVRQWTMGIAQDLS